MNELGIDVSKLAVGTKVLIKTQNSLYKLEMLENGNAMIEGTYRFETPQEVGIAGSSDGSGVRHKWIMMGRCLEIDRFGGNPMTTSKVTGLKITSPTGNWEYEL